jgi:hypothetical protein
LVKPYNMRPEPVNTVFGGRRRGSNAPDSGVTVSSITQLPMTPPVREPETDTVPFVEVWLSEKLNE